MVLKGYRNFVFLDGLRFLCALWVVLFHLGPPPIVDGLAPLLPSALSSYAAPAREGFYDIFNGTAAVVAFFIISGFCIHYPYTSGKPLHILPFYLARATRIGVPIALTLLLAAQVPKAFHALSIVLWSLLAELIYYALYPVLHKSFRQFGVGKVLTASFAVSALLLLFPDDSNGFLWCYHKSLTWLLCLPMWLLGCLLAESLGDEKYRAWVDHQRLMLSVRVAVVVFMTLSSALHVLTPIHFKYSMLLFAPLCAVWIFLEFEQTRPSSWLLRLSPPGRACFSIYLMHPVAPLLLCYLLGWDRATLSWPLVMLSVALLSTLFYAVVERPSHYLSKRLSRLGRAAPAEALPAASPEPE